MCDILRIDHFRGLESYWSVPAGEETAVNGAWVPGPREELFEAIEKELGKNLPIIAEDLGLITPEVHALREKLGFPGMKILQFAFEAEGESLYLPHQFTDTVIMSEPVIFSVRQEFCQSFTFKCQKCIKIRCIQLNSTVKAG